MSAARLAVGATRDTVHLTGARWKDVEDCHCCSIVPVTLWKHCRVSPGSFSESFRNNNGVKKRVMDFENVIEDVDAKIRFLRSDPVCKESCSIFDDDELFAIVVYGYEACTGDT